MEKAMYPKGLMQTFLYRIKEAKAGFKTSKLIHDLLTVYGGDMISKFLGVAITVMIIRGISVGDFSEYTAFLTIAGLFPGVIGGGINRALIRYASEHISIHGDRPIELYTISLFYQLILYIIFCSIVFIFEKEVTDLLFGGKEYGHALRYGMAAGIGSLISQAGVSILQAEEKFRYYVVIIWIRQLGMAFVVAGLFFANRLDFLKTSLIFTVMEIFVAVLMMISIFKNVNLSVILKTFHNQGDQLKEFIGSTAWLIVYVFLLNAFNGLDVFMLSHFSSEAELANYGVAGRYYGMALILLGSIHAVLLPRFSKVDMQGNNNQKQFVIKWLKATSWIIIPIILGNVVLKNAYIILNGSQYEKSFPIWVVLSIGIWLSLMFSPLNNILTARKNFKFMALLGAIAFGVNFTGNYFLIPKYQGIGAAFINVLTHAIINLSAFCRIIFILKAPIVESNKHE
jgi:O-antigen/teichoic acid export membrane protein